MPGGSDSAQPAQSAYSSVDDSESAPLDARAAFDAGDAAASKAFHDGRPSLEGGHEVHRHACLGNAHVQAFTTGFTSGASLGAVVVAAGRGAQLGDAAARAVALAAAVGWACMQAVAAYLHRRSEQDYLWREFRRETWEWENYPEGEKEEMVRPQPPAAAGTVGTTTCISTRWPRSSSVLFLFGAGPRPLHREAGSSFTLRGAAWLPCPALPGAALSCPALLCLAFL